MDFPTLIVFILLALGLALIVAEVFLPSGGFITIMALVCFAASGMYAHRVWWTSNRDAFWMFCGATLVLIPMTITGTLWLLSKTRLGNHVLLEGPSREEVDPFAGDAGRRLQLIGQVGTTATLMAPGGLVQVNGERYHAVAEGGMLDPGETVEVVAVQGHRIFVRRKLPEDIESDRTSDELAVLEPPEPQPPTLINDESSKRATQLADRPSSSTPLDFDIPDS